MSKINLDRIDRFVEESERKWEEEYARIMEITEEEVRAVYDEQNEEASKDGIYESLTKDEHKFYHMVGFHKDEFDNLADILIPYIESNGRGRKRSLLPKDVIALILYFLRHYPRYEDILALFGIPESTFRGILTSYLPKFKEALEHEFIVKLRSECEITYNQDFPDCGFAVDATVQEILVPSHNFSLAKSYYSQKHKTYCLKRNCGSHCHWHKWLDS